VIKDVLMLLGSPRYSGKNHNIGYYCYIAIMKADTIGSPGPQEVQRHIC